MLSSANVSFGWNEWNFWGMFLLLKASLWIQKKVRDVLNWESPKLVHQIRQFLGLAGYYRRFIPDFSKIAQPMTKLL